MSANASGITTFSDMRHITVLRLEGRMASRRCKIMKTAAARTPARFRNILFATDFSAAAANAIPYAKQIAKHYDADLVAVHVRPPVVNPMTEPASWPTDIEAAK